MFLSHVPTITIFPANTTTSVEHSVPTITIFPTNIKTVPEPGMMTAIARHFELIVVAVRNLDQSTSVFLFCFLQCASVLNSYFRIKNSLYSFPI